MLISRSCPSCHSIGTPRGTCRAPWHWRNATGKCPMCGRAVCRIPADHVELNQHNGRPTLLILDTTPGPLMAWLYAGYPHGSDTWVYAALTEAEADVLASPEAPLWLDEWLGERPRFTAVGCQHEGLAASLNQIAAMVAPA